MTRDTEPWLDTDKVFIQKINITQSCNKIWIQGQQVKWIESLHDIGTHWHHQLWIQGQHENSIQVTQNKPWIYYLEFRHEFLSIICSWGNAISNHNPTIKIIHKWICWEVMIYILSNCYVYRYTKAYIASLMCGLLCDMVQATWPIVIAFSILLEQCHSE